MKKKTLKKPKSRQAIRLKKARQVKTIRRLTRKSKPIDPIVIEEPDFFHDAIESPSDLKGWDSNEHGFEIHGVSPILQQFSWQGLLTIKFHSAAYSKDDPKGEGQRNRLKFLADFMENLRAKKFRISPREFAWVACEEFGKSGMGHLHVLFSFDPLRKKGRADKIPRMEYFSENGDFDREGTESLAFTCKSLGINPSSVVFHWSPMWENRGLVDYFCKIEFGRSGKDFEWSKFCQKHGISKAA